MKLNPTAVVSLVDSTELLEDPTALRQRATVDGILFFRGLLPMSEIRKVREEILDLLTSAGLLTSDATVERPIANIAAYDQLVSNGDYFDTGLTREIYTSIQRLESFHALALNPKLVDVYRQLFGVPVLPHARNIARVQIPSERSVPTPPHQDYIFIQGNTDTWTAWAPLGACPTALGGLAVLRGSHREGVLDYRRAGGAGGLEAYICGMNLAWFQGDYEAGDLITFNSQTVHKALPNQTSEVRLSVDFRYQPSDLPLVTASLEPHGDIGTWEEVYKGWSSQYPKYYWLNHNLTVAEYDPVVKWQKEHIC